MKKIKTLIVTCMVLCLMPAFSYDFKKDVTDGFDTYPLYYNILSSDVFNGYTVEVTYDDTYTEDTEYTNVTIPDSVEHDGIYYHVTAIGGDAFLGQKALESITIPKSVVSITTCPFGAFDACENLSYIYVNSDNPVYDSRNDCNAIIETATNTLLVGSTTTIIPSTVTKIGNVAFMDRAKGCFTIPDNVSEIGVEAFSGNELLTSVQIGSGLEIVGAQAFTQCPALGTVSVSADNGHLMNLDGALVTKDTTRFIYVPAAQAGVYRIPEGVINIADGAFESSQLSLITIPKSTKIIEGSASFNDCAADTIVCKPLTLPTDGYGNTANFWAHNTVLCVPYEALSVYKTAYSSQFSSIIGFSEVEDITEESAVLKWIHEPEVTQYTIDIYQGSTHVAKYTVNNDGEVISSQRFVPSIFHQKMDTTSSSTDYFVLTIKDLSSSTEYTYEITGTNAAEESIYHEQGAFVTTGTEALPPVEADNSERKTRKILRNGQLYLMYEGRMYDVRGQLQIFTSFTSSQPLSLSER